MKLRADELRELLPAAHSFPSPTESTSVTSVPPPTSEPDTSTSIASPAPAPATPAKSLTKTEMSSLIADTELAKRRQEEETLLKEWDEAKCAVAVALSASDSLPSSSAVEEDAVGAAADDDDSEEENEETDCGGAATLVPLTTAMAPPTAVKAFWEAKGSESRTFGCVKFRCGRARLCCHKLIA